MDDLPGKYPVAQAVKLQAASLPATLPRLDHLHLNAEYRPGSDEATIGGDWYDAFSLDDGRVVVNIGDVIGHGLQAAITMTKLRQALQSAAMINPDPNLMLTVADRSLKLLDPDAYATAAVAVYDREAHTLTLASAGHPGPFVRTREGTIQEYRSPGSMLGLRSGDETDTVTIPMPAQCTVLFFTDGLVESTRDSEASQQLVREALARDDIVFGDAPARAIVDYVLGTGKGTDDIAVLVAQTGRTSDPPAAPARATAYRDANVREIDPDGTFDASSEAATPRADSRHARKMRSHHK
jgi:serine phosphatase RsbU (regulator of sigma subunit)